MRVECDGKAITTFDEWKLYAGPKRTGQWVEGRSAFELAHAWIGTGTPTMPEQVRELLDSRAETRGITVDVVHPEHRIAFDNRRGEPRNADLAFIGRVGTSTIAVTVEGKADEPFGSTVAETMADALERLVENERSEGLERVKDLARSLFPVRGEGTPRLGMLRYQLLTAAAGTLAYAIANAAACGVLLVHEFDTSKTRPDLQVRNDDYQAFLHRLAGGEPVHAAGLLGPIRVPGLPLFSTVPPLFVGKVTTKVER